MTFKMETALINWNGLVGVDCVYSLDVNNIKSLMEL